MGRRIVVSCACQSFGIADALQLLLPNDEVEALPDLVSSDAAKQDQIVLSLARANVLIVTELLDAFGLDAALPSVEIVRVPFIAFDAFHPDALGAAYDEQGGEVSVFLIAGDGVDRSVNLWNSSIVLWAWLNGIERRAVGAFFQERYMAELGYLDLWAPSCDSLREKFDACGLDFMRFYLSCKRQPVFMHTPNHPRIHALAQLAKQIAVKLGASSGAHDAPIEPLLSDGHVKIMQWPIYPAVGDGLSIPSSYQWRLSRLGMVDGLEAYIDYAFASYDRQGKTPAQISAPRFADGNFDRVLGR